MQQQGFTRFSDEARHAVIWAQEEAMDRGHDCIGSGHIMLGLLTADSGAAKVLAALGVDRAELLARISSGMPPGRARPGTPKQLAFSPRAKKILELTLREALQLRHQYMGAEHILLALIREEQGQVAQTLRAFSVDLDPARAEVVRLVEVQGQPLSAGQTAAEPARAGKRQKRDDFGPRLDAVETRLTIAEERNGLTAAQGRPRPEEEYLPRLVSLEARLARLELQRGVPPRPQAAAKRRVRPADLWQRFWSADARLARIELQQDQEANRGLEPDAL
jgi:ATP-dependent Clp protease ATP-binding subunit ClpA